jgi:hypothetical protein
MIEIKDVIECLYTAVPAYMVAGILIGLAIIYFCLTEPKEDNNEPPFEYE